MTGVCRRRRKMMGRGAEDGCGMKETPGPVSRVPAKKSAKTPSKFPLGQTEKFKPLSIGLLEEAQKALSVRSPFDAEDSSAPVNPVLPASFASFFSKHSDLRKRQKRSNLGLDANSVALQRPGSSIWVETEEYFRDVTTDDIQRLHDLYSLRSLSSNKCLFIPRLPNESRSPATNCNGDETHKEEHVKASASVLCNEENAYSTVSPFAVERLLASRNRCILSKKWKLGDECGLENVLEFCPAEGHSTICHLCCLSGTESNRMLHCCACHTATHQKCYGVHVDVGSSWLCSWCEYVSSLGETPSGGSISTLKPCMLCPKQGGALKLVQRAGGVLEFAHLFCSLWMPELYIENTLTMEPIMGVDKIDDSRSKLLCYICKVKHGVCVPCSHGVCRVSFHPLCARETGNKMEIWCNSICTHVELQAFCSKHSGAKFSHPSGNSSVGVIGKPIPTHPSTELSLNKHGIIKNTQKSGDGSGDAVMGDSINDEGTVQSQETAFLDNQTARQPEHSEELEFHATMASKMYDRNDILALVLKKLIDRGKIGTQNLSAEIGFSKASMDTSIANCYFAPDMRSKIIRWLEDHAYMCTSRKHANLIIKDSLSQEEPLPDSMLVSSEQEGMPVVSDKGNSRIMQAGDTTGNTETSTSLGSNHNVLDCPIISESNQLNIHTPSGCYINPFIEEKIMEMQSRSHAERVSSSLSASSSTGICCKERLELMGLDKSSRIDVNLERIEKAKNTGILSFSPSDELEGEIIHLQNKLVQNAAARRHFIDALSRKVVSKLPMEVESSRRVIWDSVLVNKYVSELREAKKQGRKERKHKEAQAVLAAANAAASNSRLPSSRKDSSDHSNMEAGPSQVPLVRGKDYTEKHSTQPAPVSDSSKLNVKFCDVCMRPDALLNPVLLCLGCKVAVHLDCYYGGRVSTGPWYCELCEERSSIGCSGMASRITLKKPQSAVACVLCSGSSGAFRKSTDGQWVHAFCAEWLCQITFRRGQINPPELPENMYDGSNICCICNRIHGVCVKCNHGHCRTAFSPYCARAHGFYMSARTVGSTLQHKAYCEKHSTEQREKVHNCRVEEMKNLKETRVELERLRLLCERIIKREKLKRELVVCSQHMIVAKRDAVASSPFLEGPLVLEDLSLESATTSLKGQTDGNKSSSEPFQRSDDVTIDSATVSSKKLVRLPICVETDDSSTSQHYLMKKTDERVQFSGKKIPRVAFGKTFKRRKMPENFEKELVMTSEQAKVKNRRLPKGYVYVPVGCLQKKEDHDSKSQGPPGSNA